MGFREITALKTNFFNQRGFMTRILMLIYKLRISLRTMMIAQSDSMRADILDTLRVNPENIKTIYNPVYGNLQQRQGNQMPTLYQSYSQTRRRLYRLVGLRM